MNREQIESIVKNLIHDAVAPQANINLSDNLSYDLGLGSYDKMFLLSEVEDTFGIIMPDDCMDQINTVADLIDAIEQRI
jgi:acyl carrier protein